jgi:hypothetical protein
MNDPNPREMEIGILRLCATLREVKVTHGVEAARKLANRWRDMVVSHIPETDVKRRGKAYMVLNMALEQAGLGFLRHRSSSQETQETP